MIALNAHLTSNKQNPGCTDAAEMGEKELSSFFGAVTELFGTEEARLSAEDWLRELNELNGLPSSLREWRTVTVRAARRLASRVMATFPSIESQILRRKLCVFLSLELQAS